MLVLRRKRGEKVAIDGGRIVVTVLEFEGDNVKLGFDAPREIEVHRTEVQDRINRERGLTCGTSK